MKGKMPPVPTTMFRIILMFTLCFTMGKSCKIRECSAKCGAKLSYYYRLKPLKMPSTQGREGGLIIHMTWNARTYIELALI
jgi:hypothetical protein